MNNELVLKYCKDTLTSANARTLFNELKNTNTNEIACEVGTALALEFYDNTELVHDVAIFLFQQKRMYEAYDVYQKLLSRTNLTENQSNIAIFNQHFSIDSVADRYIEYNSEIVNDITNHLKEKVVSPHIVFTITTCKRIDLFEKTINSVLNCCTDLHLIDEWVCVDDNSSEQDREQMRKKYPFFTFVLKDETNKGHARSMNIIRNHVLKSGAQYSLHMEDDWKFFEKRDYITQALNVLSSDNRIGQCLFNKNYAETEADVALCGGDFHTTPNGFRYYIHEMVETDEQRTAWEKKHLSIPRRYVHCNYWAHYSLRPSVLKTEVYEKVGEFNEQAGHFEMEYAYRYFKTHNYVSAFFEGIYCLHIGRLTSQRFDETKQNAYNLNDESQFGNKRQVSSSGTTQKQKIVSIRTLVVNLAHRVDRWQNFRANATDLSFLNYERFEAVDGSDCNATLWLQRLFDGNDYNMRVGLVGCAMSHIKLYVEMLKSNFDIYVILEDDLTFTPNFETKFKHLLTQLENHDWDMCYMGHHLRGDASEQEKADAYDRDAMPRVEKWNSFISFMRSLGGTGGYLINRRGAERLLEFIEKNGMTNGIDTVQQKAADFLNVFYAIPHLYYTDCWRGTEKIDTDIQFNYDSLTLSPDKRIQKEFRHYGDKLKTIEKPDEFNDTLTYPVFYTGEHVDALKQTAKRLEEKYRWFCVGDNSIFIVPIEMAPSRLKNEKGEWYVPSL